MIVPAFNEESSIVLTVESLLKLDYPAKEIVVVDDGSTDQTLLNLIERFQLVRMDFIYRPRVKSLMPAAFYHNPHVPELTVVAKPLALKRAIVNLLDNALEYSPTKTPVEASLKNFTIKITDYGKKIPEDKRRVIFKRFHKKFARMASLAGAGRQIHHADVLVDGFLDKEGDDPEC